MSRGSGGLDHPVCLDHAGVAMKRVAMKRFSVVSVVGLVAALLVAVGGGSVPAAAATTGVPHIWPTPQTVQDRHDIVPVTPYACLLYTSDAADDLLCVDLGGRRIIKKKK